MAARFEGVFTVDTPQEQAFVVLADAGRFSPLLPTYLSHELREDGTSDVAVKVGVGKIRGTAVVNLELSSSEAPRAATWTGKGKIMGGAFNLTAAFDLDDAGGGRTTVRWNGELTIFGKLMSLAGGLIEPIARKQIQELVDAIQSALSQNSESANVQQPGTA